MEREQRNRKEERGYGPECENIYESSDIEYLKNKISELEPKVRELELAVGSKLRQAERVRRECDQAARECLELSLADLKDSDASNRMRELQDEEGDLIEEFIELKSAYEDEWCSVAMLKSRLEELIEEQEVEADGCEIKEREYNPEYDIPDEFFAIEEKEEEKEEGTKRDLTITISGDEVAVLKAQREIREEVFQLTGKYPDEEKEEDSDG